MARYRHLYILLWDSCLKLYNTLELNKSQKVFINNLFTSLKLIDFMRKRGIWTVGTKHSDRMFRAMKLLVSKKELTKEGRGANDYERKRFSSKEENIASVKCPEINRQHDRHMGRVDLCDILICRE